MKDTPLGAKRFLADSDLPSPFSRREFILGSSGALLVAGTAVSQFGSSSSEASPTEPSSSDCQPLLEEAKMPEYRIDESMEARYERAQFIWRVMWGQEKTSYNTTVYPHWIKDSNSFWYMRELKTGSEYRLVDAKKGTNDLAFDHGALAISLSKISGQTVEKDTLPLNNLEIEEKYVKFTAFERRWQYDNQQKSCKEIKPYYSNDWKVSPDGKHAVFVKEHNLWLVNLKTSQEEPLTTDGDRHYSYAATSTVFGRQEWVTTEAIWSSDSKRILSLIRDTREVKSEILMQYVPTDGSFRPKPTDPERRVAFPQDGKAEVTHFISIDIRTRRKTRADYRPSYQFYPPYFGAFNGERAWWGADDRRAYYIDLSLDGTTGRLLEFDTHTGKTKVLIEDRDESGFHFTPYTHLSPILTYLPDSNELIWFSGRSGWPHLYLYDLNTGRLKKKITQGKWMLRSILHVDVQRRELIIQTAGRKKGRNPYYCDICRVKIDTGELKTLLASDYEYTVMDSRSRVAAVLNRTSKGVAENGNYMVVTQSRADQLPVSVLINRNGEILMELESATVSGMPNGWRLPEPIVLKAADGKTDCYAAIYRPSNFDPKKSYPIIDVTYSGVSTPVGSFSNAFGQGLAMYMGAAYAELGFIAVSIETRGGYERGRAFGDYSDPRVPRSDGYNHVDRISMIKQMANLYPYMDIERVGVSPPGSVENAVTALLGYPEFFKVGVSLNAHTDYRIFSAYAGLSDEGHTRLEEMAGSLQGKLLLLHGMLDDVVPMANPLRLVDAFQRANKPIDMLLLPNEGHSFSPESMTYAWDYLVKHLLGILPPREASLKNTTDRVRGAR